MDGAESIGDILKPIMEELRQLREMQQAALSPWMTREEAAIYTRVSMDTIDRWLSARKITPHHPSKGITRIERRELDLFMSGSKRFKGSRGRKTT